MQEKHIAVIGAGGVGGFFAAKLMDAGFLVSLVARGKHLNKIIKRGLTLKTEGRELTLKPYMATDNIKNLPPLDFALITVKGYDLEGIVNQLSTVTTFKTVILPLLNGVDIYERTVEKLSTGIVLPGCVYISSHIEQPGTVSHTGGKGLIIFGKDPRYPDYDAEEIKAIFNKAGIVYQWEEDPFPAIWTKFVFIASFALVTAYSHKTIGEVLDNEELTQLIYSVGKEIVEIAKRKDIKISTNVIEEAIKKAHSFPHDTKTSYQRDIETPGKPNEGNLFGGTIIRMGKELAIATPTTEKLYTSLTGK